MLHNCGPYLSRPQSIINLDYKSTISTCSSQSIDHRAYAHTHTLDQHSNLQSESQNPKHIILTFEQFFSFFFSLKPWVWQSSLISRSTSWYSPTRNSGRLGVLSRGTSSWHAHQMLNIYIYSHHLHFSWFCLLNCCFYFLFLIFSLHCWQYLWWWWSHNYHTIIYVWHIWNIKVISIYFIITRIVSFPLDILMFSCFHRKWDLVECSYTFISLFEVMCSTKLVYYLVLFLFWMLREKKCKLQRDFLYGIVRKLETQIEQVKWFQSSLYANVSQGILFVWNKCHGTHTRVDRVSSRWMQSSASNYICLLT